MAIYTVHLPRATGNRLADAEGAVFVPEAFSWGALILGPLWLLGNRLWLGAIGWLLAVGAVAAAFNALNASAGKAGLAAFLVAAFFGFEGRQLIRAKLTRKGYRLTDVVLAGSAREAEHSFYARWLASGGAAAAGGDPVARGRARAGTDVIGLFPEPGGRT